MASTMEQQIKNYARALGQKGGQATYKKYGKEFYSRMVKKRWANRSEISVEEIMDKGLLTISDISHVTSVKRPNIYYYLKNNLVEPSVPNSTLFDPSMIDKIKEIVALTKKHPGISIKKLFANKKNEIL